eukprot:132207_1
MANKIRIQVQNTEQLFIMVSLIWIIFATSSVLLTVLFCLALQQICITKTTNKQRICRTLSITLFSLYGILYNALGYISSIYSHYKLFGNIDIILINHIISDVLMTIIGTHIYRRVIIT